MVAGVSGAKIGGGLLLGDKSDTSWRELKSSLLWRCQGSERSETLSTSCLGRGVGRRLPPLLGQGCMKSAPRSQVQR